MSNLPKKRRRPQNLNRLIALAFLSIIAVGTGLLMLPVASRDGQSAGFVTSLFTATSSTCVTGLILKDTFTQWSGFGQIVIITMIEIGGLGFMSVASFMIFVLRRKVNINQRMLMAQSLGVENMSDATRIQKRMLIGSIGVQALGGILLTIRFCRDFPFLTSLKLGFFHAISAFCNAGFDILGFIEPGCSVAPYGKDIAVVAILTFLIVFGGLGFIVWDEVFRFRSPKKWSVYTRLVLITSAALLIVGAGLIYLTEWNNPLTLGSMTTADKLTAGFFQSVTTRTAGFDGLGQGGLTDAGKGITDFLMLIGGSSGSTAGGLKTVTFTVIVLFLLSKLRGKDTLTVFHRTIPEKLVTNALTIFGIMVLLAFIGATVISGTSPVSFTDGLFESVSALATVGLTAGATPQLSLVGKILIIIYMYFGRVGILTISLGFLSGDRTEKKYHYAKANLLIG